jgi:hypothetical protein
MCFKDLWNKLLGMSKVAPGLFGLDKSNRDFTKADSWGKNQFNSSFPCALICYMESKGFESKYIKSVRGGGTSQETISATDLFGASPSANKLFFAFESVYPPYERYVAQQLPRIDVVTTDGDSEIYRGLEIKLTALPDNTTRSGPASKQSCELVIRPDTIVYLVLSIIRTAGSKGIDLGAHMPSEVRQIDWSDGPAVRAGLVDMLGSLRQISTALLDSQRPILVQPVWKTDKNGGLAERCLDCFVWSDLALMDLYMNSAARAHDTRRVNATRQERTVYWTMKMLLDFVDTGHIRHEDTIDQLSFDTKNDKAFSVTGIVTHPYLSSTELEAPRIRKVEIKNIILGGGQGLLSPERRLDAIIKSSPDLFD